MSVSDPVAEARPFAGSESGLFLRKSSGLVREVGFRDSIAISAGIMVLMFSIVGIAIFQVSLPNTDWYLAIGVGALVSLVLCMSYAQLVSTFARSGGEYVYASRVFSPVVGAVVGGAVLVAVALNCANTVVAISQIGIQFMFTTIGSAIHSHALTTFGTSTLVGKTPYLIVSLVVLAGFSALGLRPLRAAMRWLFWFFALGLLGFLVVLGLLAFTSHSAFVHDFNSASPGKNAYQAIIAQATKAGWHPGSTLSGALLGIPFGFLFFAGFTFANYAAGEIKRPSRTYKISVLAVLGFSLLAGLAVWGALRHTVGLHFLQGSAALSAANPAEYAKITAVAQNQGGLAYALVISGDPVTKFIIGFGLILALLANGLAYFLLIPRIVFALSFDRLLPTRMADVREKTHSPVYAVALAAVGVAAFSVLGDETTFLSLLRNLLLIATAIFAIGSLAAAALPYRRRDLYDASPKAFPGEFLGIPRVTWLGSASFLGCAALDFVLATHTIYSGGFSGGSIATLIVVLTAGGVMYVLSRFALRRRGIDLRMAMHELPPE